MNMVYNNYYDPLSDISNPDVMMEAYLRQPLSPAFFVIYIVIQVYFVSNVVCYIYKHML